VVATDVDTLHARAPLAIRQRDGRVCLSGELDLDDGATIWRTLREAAEELPPDAELDIDLTNVTAVDGGVVALLVAFRTSIYERGGRCEIVGAKEHVRRLVELYHGYDEPRPRPAPARRSIVERIGDAVLASAHSVRRFIEYTGDLVLATGGAVTRPATGNWTAVFPLSVEAGLDGVPIVLFLDFLVGFVMGYQSARQLEMYGANVFVADVVGLSVTRELGPLVTGIIIVGRSGAAFAAEIGTMKVSEELDALRTMGLSPSRYLVLPRVLALVIVAPILTLLGDVVGVAGGAVVGAISLGVSPGAFASELRNAVVIKDVTGGLIKSAFFGLAIALVACQQGLATRGGATGVGRRTTSTVVVCLFAIVIIDAIFAVIFRVMGQ
jgi:phospholipid/cholesterol/gamma-HCH transport system permease protein